MLTVDASDSDAVIADLVVNHTSDSSMPHRSIPERRGSDGIDRLMDPATKSGMRSFYKPVHSVEVLDPLTVQVRLKEPNAFFLHMLAAYRTGLVLYSPTATQKFTVEDRKQGKPEAVVGCGPFKLVEWVQGGQLVMDRFDKYFV